MIPLGWSISLTTNWSDIGPRASWPILRPWLTNTSAASGVGPVTPAGPPTAHPPKTTPIRTLIAPASWWWSTTASSKNYSSLKNELTAKGHVFTSETDTEVLAHLIEDRLQGDPVAAVRAALARVEGSYAIGVLWAKEPELLVAARNHSPLVMGVASDACYIASDIPGRFCPTPAR